MISLQFKELSRVFSNTTVLSSEGSDGHILCYHLGNTKTILEKTALKEYRGVCGKPEIEKLCQNKVHMDKDIFK